MPLAACSSKPSEAAQAGKIVDHVVDNAIREDRKVMAGRKRPGAVVKPAAP